MFAFESMRLPANFEEFATELAMCWAARNHESISQKLIEDSVLFVCEKSLKDKNAWALYPGLVKLETIMSHHIPGIFAPTVVPTQNTGPPKMARHARLLIVCLYCDLFISCISKKVGPKTDFVQHTTTFQICVSAMQKLICVRIVILSEKCVSRF